PGAQVGLGEVPVVGGLFLAATRPRVAARLVEVPRLLGDLAAGVEYLGLAQHLRADGPLDRAQRVDVLRLGAGAPLVARAVQRRVAVAAQAALFHPDVAAPDSA